MKSRFNLIALVFALIGLFLLPGVVTSLASEIPDMPRNYVVDLASIVNDSAEVKLNGFLRELEQKTTAQMVVLTIDTLEDRSIDGFSLEVAEKWKLGQKGKDNGALLLVALKEKKYRFEIGYGLEGILPDSLVGSIGRNYIVPFFKKGDYSNGITAAVLAAANEIAASSEVEITGMPKLRAAQRNYRGKSAGKPGILSSILTILFFIGMAYLFIKHPRLLILFLLFSGMGPRRGWGGGGFGGGGFGGFGGGGGGGGGGFGGGGASGGW